ncbi:uncharacterized protein DUF3179 [Natranaerovirga pectinivora]|uniref:Uncharacterized protein DUF3179 n=1 Tax=Natranaerovirga pectinivora TaxID=682400 RepID=A0A4R3MQF0_9FIRM|nr:DUF3179 domain-containing protein [Natranaerovirga pectinivora]TCT17112.1 uncharacterized protein DUF3179 [Natranaerovirga pectinivora]
MTTTNSNYKNELWAKSLYYYNLFDDIKEFDRDKAFDYYQASNYYLTLYHEENENSPEIYTQESEFPEEIIRISHIMDLDTNWSKHIVPYSELTKLQPKDRIVTEKDLVERPVKDEIRGMKDDEPVIVANVNGITKAYPIKELLWNPVINDFLGDIPIVITYCPLCNIAFVFNREVQEEILTFGFSGMLYNSCVVFYDFKTESLWDSLTGICLAGDYAGNQLSYIPKNTVSYSSYKRDFPDGTVVANVRGILRPITKNPYIAYDLIKKPLFFYKQIDPRLPAMERVVGIWNDDRSICYSYSDVLRRKVIENEFEGEDFIIFHKFGMISPLSDPIADGRDIGSTSVFSPYVDGIKLNFYVVDNRLFDVETNSEWSSLGVAIDGFYKGTQLRWIRHADTYWFVWAAYFPEVTIRR